MAGLSLAMRSDLTEKGIEALFQVLLREAATRELDAPKSSEKEDDYTARCLAPMFNSVLESTGIRDLLLGGHHTGINRPIRYLGADFYPDLTVIQRERRLIAIEVKILRDNGSRSTSISAAIGQAAAYRAWGHKRTMAILIDASGRTTRSQVEKSGRKTVKTGLALLIRNSRRDGKLQKSAVVYPDLT